MQTEDEALGQNVRAFREALGMSQAELARRLIEEAGLRYFHPQTITKIEKGTRSLKFIEGVALAAILGIEPADLADFDTEDPRREWEVRRVAAENRIARLRDEIAATTAMLEVSRAQLEKYEEERDNAEIRLAALARRGSEPEAKDHDGER